ncbi:Uncharacterised protein [Mycobacterium tuberculosis]|nr:Uncharacterised protein [Mycobacterium tuberculosis]
MPLMASLAAVLILAMRAMPAWLIGSPSWLMMNRTACPSGERNCSRPRWKSGLSKTSGGR